MSTPFHDEVMELSGKLSTDISSTNGVSSIVKTAYIKNLPETLTAEHAEQLQKYNNAFFPAATHAFGEHAIKEMKNNGDLNQMTLEIPMVGKDHYDITINRSRTFRNPQDESTPVVKWGYVQDQLVTHALKNGKGEMSAVRDRLAEMALENLCK